MSLIPNPASLADASGKSRPGLDRVNAQLGVAPNMHQPVSTSAAGLEGCLGMSGALAKVSLAARPPG